mgnify:CR=1 FL=1
MKDVVTPQGITRLLFFDLRNCFDEFDTRVENHHQPKSGNYLVSIVEEGTAHLKRSAAVTIGRAWDTMTQDQIERYLFASQTFHLKARDAYPLGVEAMIGVGPRFVPGISACPMIAKQSSERSHVTF